MRQKHKTCPPYAIHVPTPFPPPRTTGPTLITAPTLTPDQAERRARHLRQCERLGELGMELAEAAHREALCDIQPRPQRRASPFPGMADQPAPFFPRDATYGQLFAKLSRCVRQTILLEARLAAGAYDHYAPAPDRAVHAEPRQPGPPPKTYHNANDRPHLRPEQLEDESTVDAGRSAEEILVGICAELGAAGESGLSTATPAQTARPDTAGKPHQTPPKPPPFSRARAPQNGIPPPQKPV